MDVARWPWMLRYTWLRRAASTARRIAVKATHRHCTIRFGRGCYIGPGFSLFLPGRATLVVGEGVEFRRGFTCEIAGGGHVTIGRDCVFSYEATIQCSTSVNIGPGCLVAARSLIVDGSHRFRDPDIAVRGQGYDFRAITIGKETILSHGVTVLAPVGARSMIGANAVVTRPVPDYSVAVGVPARVTERFGPDGQGSSSTAATPHR